MPHLHPGDRGIGLGYIKSRFGCKTNRDRRRCQTLVVVRGGGKRNKNVFLMN